MVALRNHGNCSNGRNSSSASSNTHSPCCETCDISTAKVLVPGIDDLLQVICYQLPCFADDVICKSGLLGELNLGR